jgi:hypothetical protein
MPNLVARLGPYGARNLLRDCVALALLSQLQTVGSPKLVHMRGHVRRLRLLRKMISAWDTKRELRFHVPSDALRQTLL